MFGIPSMVFYLILIVSLVIGAIIRLIVWFKRGK